MREEQMQKVKEKERERSYLGNGFVLQLGSVKGEGTVASSYRI